VVKQDGFGPSHAGDATDLQALRDLPIFTKGLSDRNQRRAMLYGLDPRSEEPHLREVWSIAASCMAQVNTIQAVEVRDCECECGARGEGRYHPGGLSTSQDQIDLIINS
jgi:hypothetical protein